MLYFLFFSKDLQPKLNLPVNNVRKERTELRSSRAKRLRRLSKSRAATIKYLLTNWMTLLCHSGANLFQIYKGTDLFDFSYFLGFLFRPGQQTTNKICRLVEKTGRVEANVLVRLCSEHKNMAIRAGSCWRN